MKASKIATPTAPRPQINVTDKHFDEGIKQTSGHCAIQLAFEEQVPWAHRIQIDLQTIRCSDPKKGLRYIWLTPNPVMSTIIAWDYGVRPAPFSFRLRGAQITSMRIKPGRRNTSRGGHLVHKFGHRKTIIKPGDKKKRMRPTIVGGKPPPTNALRSRRIFGRKGLTIPGVKHPYELLKEASKSDPDHA